MSRPTPTLGFGISMIRATFTLNLKCNLLASFAR